MSKAKAKTKPTEPPRLPPPTPGPWKAVNTGHGWSYIVPANDESAEAIASVQRGGVLYLAVDEGAANAKLIAATPAYAKVWSMVPGNVKRHILDSLHPAEWGWVEESIAKAEGGGG
jgi:hypothetical protein